MSDRRHPATDESGGKMAAGSNDPRLGVYALSEFMFCSRAGLLAVELGDDAEDAPPASSPRLDFSPLYFSEYEIVLRLKSALTLFWGSLIAVLVLGGVYLFYWGHLSFLLRLVAGVALLSMGCLGWMMLLRLFKLTPAWDAVQNARPAEPDPAGEECQQVNWWSLRKAGFEAIPCRDKLHDDRWKVVGKPWRILRKGGLRIPVFRLRHATTRLYPQHYARMAAYCHLVQASEGQASPYGIILYPDSHDGLTVPNAAWTRKFFHDGLVRARALVREKHSPPAPKETLCAHCPLGSPHLEFADSGRLRLNGQPLAVYRVAGADERTYHSLCGDRFRWIPPHDRAEELKLSR